MRVLDGMQPTLTHVPPMIPEPTRATRFPSSAPLIAAAKPADPAPRIMRSYLSSPEVARSAAWAIALRERTPTVYPLPLTAAASSSPVTWLSATTVARPDFHPGTDTSFTPATPARTFSTCNAHASHVIPCTSSSNVSDSISTTLTEVQADPHPPHGHIHSASRGTLVKPGGLSPGMRNGLGDPHPQGFPATEGAASFRAFARRLPQAKSGPPTVCRLGGGGVVWGGCY